MQNLLQIEGLDGEKEDVLSVIQDLTTNCTDCRLGYMQQSKGLVWRGDPTRRIALVSIMPGPKEVQMGKPLVGASGVEANKWFHYIGLDTNKDMFVTNVIQCKPPDVEKKGEKKPSQREPEKDELAACFPNRCLRVLRAMPNLEVIITMGWVAARCILGGDPKDKSHMGHWYTTSLLPGKAVYCLPHPAAYLRDPTPAAKGKVTECLDNFKREYLTTNKVMDIIGSK
jgi:uracil-DNA glycosylase family 4